MKHMKTVSVAAHEKQVEDRVTCDLCGAEIREKLYSAEEVTVCHRTGDSYPEGGSGTEVDVDMCGPCFDTKLVPWLRSIGVEPVARNWSW